MQPDEVKTRWGDTEAYAAFSQKTAQYSAERFREINAGLDRLLAEFAACRRENDAPDSPEAQALAARLQGYITEHYYPCTDEILAGLGRMYVADERFRTHIDACGEGTAAFVAEAILIRVGADKAH